MASRQLRKLRKQQELLKEATPTGGSSDDEIVPVAKPRPSAFSAFAALGDIGDDDEDDDEDNGNDNENIRAKSDENENEVQVQPGSAQSSDEAQPFKKKPQKKKKKRRKPAIPPAPGPVAGEGDAVDDIDKALEELKIKDPKASSIVVASNVINTSVSQLRDLLRINFQHLKAMNEMRKLFGKAMGSAELEPPVPVPPPRSRRNPQGVDLETFLNAPVTADRSKHAMFDSLLRSNPFIDGKKTWPRGSALGLKMAAIPGPREHVVEYTFSHDKQYNELEAEFFQRVGTYDPMAIIHFLYRYPYHISSLIQSSKVAIQDQNSALAADLIERALFSFGRVSLRDFRNKLEEGRVYMDFARPENRQFFLAGWNLIRHLSLKGTFRTALEWSKLFLSINHKDPYGMIHWVHALAIRAHQAQWFIDLCKTSLLTGKTALSSSLCIKQTQALAYLQLGNRALARSVIIDGVESCPWLYSSLFKALDIDHPPSIWDWQCRDPAEAAYAALYIHMTKDLWAAADTTSLLREAAREAKRPGVLECPAPTKLTLGVARFMYLTNERDLISCIPPDILDVSPNYDFDPLPPSEKDNRFTNPSQQLPWRTAENHRDDVPGLAPFLNDPRVRAAFQARRAALHGDGDRPASPREDDRGENDQFEDQLRALEAGQDAENVGLPDDRRGFLGRVIALLVPHLLSNPQLPAPTLDEVEEARERMQRSDDMWEDVDNDLYGSDDHSADLTDNELPPLEPIDDSPPPVATPRRPYQATVEDAGEEYEDQGAERQQGERHRGP